MPTTTETVFQLGPRSVLRCGDRFRVGAGPQYRGKNIGERGEFEFRSVMTKRTRVWIEAVRVEQGGYSGTYLLYAKGPVFKDQNFPGIRQKPYTIRRVR